MKCLTLFLALLGLSSPAQAAKVVFFGGSASRAGDMNACYPGYRNIPYPADAQVSRIAAEVNANPGTQYIIGGHSSGARHVNAIASIIRNPAQVTMVNMDGYAPRSVPRAFKTICYRATNGRGLWSRNANSMSTANGCDVVRTVVQNRCSTAWCLHFAMVNLNVPGNLNDSTWISQGYKNCRPGNWAQP